jgi:putative effector of murein hydrolase LrgA (UPF0299 family)
MTLIDCCGFQLNWLEFATYVIVPSAIVIMIILYLYFNFKIFMMASELNSEIMSNLDDETYHYE